MTHIPNHIDYSNTQSSGMGSGISSQLETTLAQVQAAGGEITQPT